MALTIGTQLGSHEITALLGKGGMGEVYRARDLKLKREVAIKILPDEFSRDADRVSRFQREAEVLASLNHPNIAGIHDLAEANGSRYLVLELVEGETLADRIARDPIPVEEALNIAIQICEALEAAHERGIIHRDLKPANVKLTRDGKVKVLDFGLAKALEQAPNATLSNSPTMLSGTMGGIILGTAAYMSPEQARGKPVDRRTDVFAFGCVLYELLTGRPAFDGEDVSDILSRVLQRDPDWSLLPAELSPRIRDLLRLCLEKDVRRRRSDAADIRIDIQQAVARPPEVAALPSKSHARERFWIAVAVVSLIAVAVLITVRYFRQVTLPEMRLDINTPVGDSVSFALSPDGRYIVFVAATNGSRQLWLRALAAVNPQPLPGTDNPIYPFWSPDSRSIGFFAGGKLKRIDISGGPAQTLADASTGRGGSWSSLGTIIYAPRGNGPLFAVPASGGDAVAITRIGPGEDAHRFPHFAPDGRHFLFFLQGTQEQQGIYFASLDGERKRVVAAESGGMYLPLGWLLFLRQGALTARRFNITNGESIGDPVIIANPVTRDAGAFAAGFSVSGTDLVAYRAGSGNLGQLTWFDRSGKPLGMIGDRDELNYPVLSPDGRRIAVARNSSEGTDIWLMETGRDVQTRFTFDPGFESFPVWSPDGSHVAYRANRKGKFNLYQKPSNNTGEEELLLESETAVAPQDWSPDGRFLLFYRQDPKSGIDLEALPMQGDRKPVPVVKEPFEERGGQFSPDGHWLAYHSNASGRFEIYVVPFPTANAKFQISLSGGIAPRWRHDGKEIFYVAPDGKMMAAPIRIAGSTFEPGKAVALFQTRILGSGAATQKADYAVSSDDRFLINTSAEEGNSPITLILNWHPDQKK